VTDSRQGDGFSLVLMADPPSVVIGDPAFSPGDLLEELQTVQLRHTGANLTMTLGEIDTILERAKARHERLQDRKVFFFTDLGRTTWDEVTGDECRRRLAQLAGTSDLLLIDVGQSDVQNLAVTNLVIREPLVTVGHPVRIEAEIANFGSRDQSGRQVALYVDDQQVLAETVAVPASERTPWRLSIGSRCRASIVWRSVWRTTRWTWTTIVGRAFRCAKRSASCASRGVRARHSTWPWRLEPGLSVPPRVQVQNAFRERLMELDLLQFDAIFLCNLARFGRDEATVLRDYARNGGGLVVLLGDQVQADNYNEMLGGEPASACCRRIWMRWWAMAIIDSIRWIISIRSSRRFRGTCEPGC
jgi:hypothetical protein